MFKLFISPSSQEANVGPGGYNEEVYMNQVADILCPELTRHGIEWMRNSPGNTFVGHIAQSNAYDQDYHIGIHSNSGGVTNRGCLVLCYKPALYPDRPGTLMAEAIYNRIAALTPVDDEGIRDGSSTLSEILKTNAPACLIEVDFHDKPEGAAWIISHIPEIATAILLGILDRLGIDYIPLEDGSDWVSEKSKLVSEISDLNGYIRDLTVLAKKQEAQIAGFKDAAGVWHTDLQGIAATIAAAVTDG